jgi:hypothetical protein
MGSIAESKIPYDDASLWADVAIATIQEARADSSRSAVYGEQFGILVLSVLGKIPADIFPVVLERLALRAPPDVLSLIAAAYKSRPG